jgi:hypothetical protein
MWFKKKITKEEAEKEITEMCHTYLDHFGVGCGFLTGSSLCGNKQGDSARYWELKAITDKNV